MIAIAAIGGITFAAFKLASHPNSTQSASTNARPTATFTVTSPYITYLPLDPAVAKPTGFPSDFPLYPNAQPTYAVRQPAGSKVDYTLILETTDSPAKVGAWYQHALTQGRFAQQTAQITGLGPFAVSYVTKTTPPMTVSIIDQPDPRHGGAQITINLIVQQPPS